MGTRLQLQTLLESKLGTRNVYFQPSESVRIIYPAMIYNLSAIQTKKADNIKYLFNDRYTLTYISKNPDDSMVDEILKIPYCAFNRRFVVDNLYHNVFDLYF